MTECPLCKYEIKLKRLGRKTIQIVCKCPGEKFLISSESDDDIIRQHVDKISIKLNTAESPKITLVKNSEKRIEEIKNKNRGAMPKDWEPIDSNEKGDDSQYRRNEVSYIQKNSQSNDSNYSKTDENKKDHLDSEKIKNLIYYINKMGWKGHENYSAVQLIEIYELLKNHFILQEYCNRYDIIVKWKYITKHSIEDLRKLNKGLETSIDRSNNKQRSNKQRKKFKPYRYENDNLITNPKNIERKNLRTEIEKYLTVPIDEIKDSDLLPLKNRIEKIKTFKSEFKVSDIRSANLLILNHELESLGLDTEITIENATKSINCHKSRKILKERYPEIVLPDNCKELLKLYDEKMKPKDHPETDLSNPKYDEWVIRHHEKSDGSSGDQLHLNSESDIH